MAIRKNLSEYTVCELKEKALSKGIQLKELSGKKKIEIIELIKEKYNKKKKNGGKLIAKPYMRKVRIIMEDILTQIIEKDDENNVLQYEDIEIELDELKKLKSQFGTHHMKIYKSFILELHRNEYLIHEMRDAIIRMIREFSIIAP